MTLKQDKILWRQRIDRFISNKTGRTFTVKECTMVCGGMKGSVRKELNRRVEDGQLLKSDVLTGVMRYWPTNSSLPDDVQTKDVKIDPFRPTKLEC